MESDIVKNLKPGFEPVALVWSETIPDDAFRFKQNRFGCILYLFAEASRRQKISGCSRDNIVCPGARAALGFGVDFDTSDALLDRYTALFSKGLKSAVFQDAYRAWIDASPRRWRAMYEYGERRHCSAALAGEWIRHGLPRYTAPYPYILFKPLSRVHADDNVRAVIFPVNPLELSGLVTLAGSVMPGIDPVQVPQGADCNSITAFACAQAGGADSAGVPGWKGYRAILGMMGVDGREMMHKRFRKDVMTLALPAPLFRRMEQEADDAVFQIPSWKKLVGG